MSDIAYEKIRDALEAKGFEPRESGRGLKALCPAHEDSNPSLSVDRGSGCALVTCRTGCDTPDVLDGLGLKPSDLFDEDPGKDWTNRGLKATGANFGNDGRWRVGSGRYRSGADPKMVHDSGHERDLWPDPANVEGRTLYVVEGEPDAISGNSIGLPTVSAPGAGKKWPDIWVTRLVSGRDRVVVITDADENGRKAALGWANQLSTVCSDVRLLDIYPDRADHSDLSDYVKSRRGTDPDEIGKEIRAMAATRAVAVSAPKEVVAPYQVTIERPHDLDLERSILSVALSGRTQVSTLQENYGLRDGVFFDQAHVAIWTALTQTDGDTAPITLRLALEQNPDWLPAGQNIDRVFQVASALAGQVSTGALGEHVEALVDLAQRRRVIDAAMTTIAESQQRDISAMDVLAQAEERLIEADLAFESHRGTRHTFREAGNVLIADVLESQASHRSGGVGRINFGLKAFDDFTHGIKPGELHFLAGGPGVGKTAVALHLALQYAQAQANFAEEQRIGTLIASLEAPVVQVTHRLAQMMSRVPVSAMRSGDITDQQIETMRQEWVKLMQSGIGGELPLHITHPATMTTSQLASEVGRAIRKHNTGLVIIDHFRRFQLDRPNPRDANGDDERKVLFLEEKIAKAMNVAVICLAHTRKAPSETVDAPRPTLNDLRGSGQITASADSVVFLHRPFRAAIARGEVVDPAQRNLIEAVWAKNRNGEEGVRQFEFDASNMKINDLATTGATGVGFSGGGPGGFYSPPLPQV